MRVEDGLRVEASLLRVRIMIGVANVRPRGKDTVMNHFKMKVRDRVADSIRAKRDPNPNPNSNSNPNTNLTPNITLTEAAQHHADPLFSKGTIGMKSTTG